MIELVTTLLQNLPEDFNIEEVQKKFPVDYNESMNTVLVQEMGRYNRLLGLVRSTSNDVIKAIRGEIVMSPQLESMFNDIYDGLIPKLWMKLSYPCLKPLGAYMEDLGQRVAFLADWRDHGTPAVFWLPGFFFPQSFLTGSRFSSVPPLGVCLRVGDGLSTVEDRAVLQNPPPPFLRTAPKDRQSPTATNRRAPTATNRQPSFNTVSVVLCLAHVLTMKQRAPRVLLALRTLLPPPLKDSPGSGRGQWAFFTQTSHVDVQSFSLSGARLFLFVLPGFLSRTGRRGFEA